FDAIAIVELKRPGTPLDAPQVSYDNRTPVEQAFGYAQQLPACQWVIVTDMKLMRLYSIDRFPHAQRHDRIARIYGVFPRRGGEKTWRLNLEIDRSASGGSA